MAQVSTTVLVLLIVSCYCYTSALPVVNVVPGIFSKKTESNGLTLPPTSTFKPITALTTNIHIDKPYSVFVHYQVTLQSTNKDFYSKLLINYANAGSLVHSGNQEYKTATGFYMANLNPGYYTFEVHYKSPVAINMPASFDWQTAILQVMWFEDAHAVSDGIKCYPTPTATNTYNSWGPIEDTEVILQIPNYVNRAVLSAYQFSTDMARNHYLVSTLEVDGFQLDSPVLIKGENAFLDLHGAWAWNINAGPHHFNLQYRTRIGLSFTDCKENYLNNKNLYAMMLPPSCNVHTIRPTTKLSLSNSNIWGPTDVTYSFTLSKKSHVIIMYQYSGTSRYSHVVMRLSIDSVVQKHTVSLTGDTRYAGNFGLWQGSLDSGTYTTTLDYRSPVETENTIISPGPEFNNQGKWTQRTMNVIIC